MSARLVLVWAVVLLTATPAGAHRLDEYLQATTIAVEKGRVHAEIRLTPFQKRASGVSSWIDSSSATTSAPV